MEVTRRRGPRRPLQPHPSDPELALVPLTKGHFAVIDAADAPAVGKSNWCVMPGWRTFYAVTAAPDGSGLLSLHRFLWKFWGLPETPEIDHEDTDGLNCRRKNLRAATRQQNEANKGPRVTSISGVKGVSWDERSRRWYARIKIDRKSRFLGRFVCQGDAAAAYAAAAKEVAGSFSRTEWPSGKSGVNIQSVRTPEGRSRPGV